MLCRSESEGVISYLFMPKAAGITIVRNLGIRLQRCPDNKLSTMISQKHKCGVFGSKYSLVVA